MKSLIIQQLSAILLIAFGFTSCSKEKPFVENSNAVSSNGFSDRIPANTAKFTSNDCRICNPAINNYDLRSLQQKTKFQEGVHYFGTLYNGARVMVVVKNGKIGWQMEDKSGKTIEPDSIERRTLPGGVGRINFYRFCMYLDGVYTCFILITV